MTERQRFRPLPLLLYGATVKCPLRSDLGKESPVRFFSETYPLSSGLNKVTIERKEVSKFQIMKTSKLAKAGALLLILAVATTEAFANPQRDQVGDRYVYVWVTGSRIPQKVKISPIGTPTFNALSVWDRRQINQTGRQTTEGVLAQDPSVRVILGRSSGM